MSEQKKDPGNFGKYCVDLNKTESYVEFLNRVAKAMNLEYTGRTTEESFPIFINKQLGIEFEVIEETECFRLEMINL